MAGALPLRAQDRAYIALHNAAQVAVVDVNDGSVRTRIPVGPLPRSTVTSADGKFAFALNEGNKTISIIDTGKDEVVSTIDIEPALEWNPKIAESKIAGMAVLEHLVPSPTGDEVYIACMSGVVAIDWRNRKTRFIGFGLDDEKTIETADGHIAISGDGRSLFVSQYSVGGLSIINTQTMKLSGTLPGLMHVPFAIAPRGDFAVSVDLALNQLRLARMGDSIGRTLPFRATASRRGLGTTHGAEISPDGKRLYVTRLVDDADGRARYRIFGISLENVGAVMSPPLGDDPPSGIALTGDGRKLVVVTPATSRFIVLDATTLATLVARPLGPTPMAYRAFVVGRGPKHGDPGPETKPPSDRADPAPGHREKPPAPPSVLVRGHAFPLVPVRLPDRDMTWEKAKQSLPADLLRPTAAIGSRRDVMVQVDRLLRASQRQYEASLRTLVDHLVRRGIAQSRDALELALVEKFKSGTGAGISPDTQRFHDQYVALLYLREMLARSEAANSPAKGR